MLTRERERERERERQRERENLDGFGKSVSLSPSGPRRVAQKAKKVLTKINKTLVTVN